MDVLSVVTRVPILVFGVERNDDDFADRINYKYTVAVLVAFAIIVTNRQFGTKQIHCWIPAYFTRNYEEYINDICWVSNTYYISLDQKLPEAEQIRKSFELKYYQWVPFILLLQAFFFYIPHIAWRALSRRSGIDIRDIVEAASNYKSVDKYENRAKYMSYMLTSVDQYVDDPRRRKDSRRMLLIKRLISGLCFISGKFLGNYLMVLYLFIKLAFIANCICQLFVLNLLLGHEFHKFGFELMDKILNGKGWDTGSRIFPKISMCDFRIREVGNPKVSHRYTVQCVLPINLFNQQIFTFIWFWYSIVLLVNIYSLFVWTYRFLPNRRLRYISRRIEIMRQAIFYRNKNPLVFESDTDPLQLRDFEKDLITHFVYDYLESDGLFILRVLSSNTSDFVCTELIQELWRYYRKQRKFNRQLSDDDPDEMTERGDSADESTVHRNQKQFDFEENLSAKVKPSSKKNVNFSELKIQRKNTKDQSGVEEEEQTPPALFNDSSESTHRQQLLKKSSANSYLRYNSTGTGNFFISEPRPEANGQSSEAQQQQPATAAISTSDSVENRSKKLSKTSRFKLAALTEIQKLSQSKAAAAAASAASTDTPALHTQTISMRFESGESADVLVPANINRSRLLRNSIMAFKSHQKSLLSKSIESLQQQQQKITETASNGTTETILNNQNESSDTNEQIKRPEKLGEFEPTMSSSPKQQQQHRRFLEQMSDDVQEPDLTVSGYKPTGDDNKPKQDKPNKNTEDKSSALKSTLYYSEEDYI